MNSAYDSGLPYSDTYIAHYGIKGMHWYERRFQNEDGTLTEEGKERYRKGGGLDRIKSRSESRIATGAKAAGRVLGKGAVVVGKTVGKGVGRLGEGIGRGVKGTLAKKFPWMLNDEELARYTNRYNMENAYKQSQANRKSIKKSTESENSKWLKQLGRDIAGNSLKTIASKAVNEWADDNIKSKSKRDEDERRDRMQELRDEAEIFRMANDRKDRERTERMNAVRDEAEIDRIDFDREERSNKRESNMNKANIERAIREYVEDSSKIRLLDNEDSRLKDDITKLRMNENGARRLSRNSNMSEEARAKAQSRISELHSEINEKENRRRLIANERQGLKEKNNEKHRTIAQFRNEYDRYAVSQKNKSIPSKIDQISSEIIKEYRKHNKDVNSDEEAKEQLLAIFEAMRND